MNKDIKISVVTICYNVASTIEATMLSVLNQTYPNVEYIVIDGGSTDGTLDIIKRYADRLAYWISEPDKGIYDAMNKGIRAATGEWINFMNAGDSFVNSQVIEDCFTHTYYTDNERVLYGNCIYKYNWGFRKTKPERLEGMKKRMTMCHQSVFLRRYKDIPFDLRYKLSADYNQLLTLYMDHQKFKYVDCYVALEEMQDGSTYNIFERSKRESRLIQESLGFSPFVCWRNYWSSVIRFRLSNWVKSTFPNDWLMKVYKSNKSID
jgi:glycosyltransferase involved in cell wall biosynthesis